MGIIDKFENKEPYHTIDCIQLDAAFEKFHRNYDQNPLFNGKKLSDFNFNILKNEFIIHKKNFEDDSYRGTTKRYSKKDKLELWKCYFDEYINSFNKMTEVLPKSIVTVYIGRHAIELGLKYLIIKKSNVVKKEHNLGILAKEVSCLYNLDDLKDNNLESFESFCSFYCNNIEGNNTEYFKYPEYKSLNIFNGNHLDIEWLSYNFAIIILKIKYIDNLN